MSDKSFPTTNGGRLLARGDTFDPECSRTTHRLRVALSILRGLGITPTHEHEPDCRRHPDNLLRVCHGYREGVCCSCGRDYKGSEWPEYATGAIFDLAYKLADEYQTERGAYHQRAINAARAAQRADDAQRALDENDDQRDYAEERFNQALLREE